MQRSISEILTNHWKISDVVRTDGATAMWRLLRNIKREIPVELPYAFVDGQIDPDISLNWDLANALKHEQETKNIYSLIRR